MHGSACAKLRRSRLKARGPAQPAKFMTAEVSVSAILRTCLSAVVYKTPSPVLYIQPDRPPLDALLLQLQNRQGFFLFACCPARRLLFLVLACHCTSLRLFMHRLLFMDACWQVESDCFSRPATRRLSSTGARPRIRLQTGYELTLLLHVKPLLAVSVAVIHYC